MLRRACLSSANGSARTTTITRGALVAQRGSVPFIAARSTVAAPSACRVASRSVSTFSNISTKSAFTAQQRNVPSVGASTTVIRCALIGHRLPASRAGFSTLILGSSNKATTTKRVVAKTATTKATTAPVGSAVRSFSSAIQSEPPTRQLNSLYIAVGSAAAAGLGLLVFNGIRKNAQESSLGNGAQKRLAQTYAYVASGIGLTAATATYLFRNGAAMRIMAVRPWVMVGASLVTTIGSMVAITALPQENTVGRHVAFVIFNTAMAASLSPLGFMGGRLILNAMAGTGVMVSALSLVAASAPLGSLQSFEGPLGIGLGVVIASSIGQMLFPSALLMNLVVYGGLAVFGGLMLTDTQRVMTNARDQEVYDPMSESLSIYLNIINIFQRLVFILSDRQRK
eukprot:TRINITY_DN5894_c0_g1_i1.p1 TRINITY_DN5894_c0_g1~~TRINITY_DN5894_c0_g1_i1.p1  ORF type:complete len:398 (+),score=39.49 TRINITY_DN5894_c0_g1_i1:79-1272(+)